MNKPLPTQGEIADLVKELGLSADVYETTAHRLRDPSLDDIRGMLMHASYRNARAADALEALNSERVWKPIDWEVAPRNRELELWFTGVEPYEKAQIMIGRFEFFCARLTPVIRSTVYSTHRDRFTHYRELPAPPLPHPPKEEEGQ